MIWRSLRRFSTLSSGEALLLKHVDEVNQLRAESTRLVVDPQDLSEVDKNQFLDTGVLKYFGLNRDRVNLFRPKTSLDNSTLDKTVNFPRKSFFRLELEISKSAELQQVFTRFYTDRFRIGKLLEVFDYLAGITAYNYSYADLESRSCTFVTACMDRWQPFNKVSVKNDLIMTSYPTYVGTSSVEIRLDVASRVGEKEIPVGSTHYVMIGRNATDHSKPFQVPRLSFEGETDPQRCALRFELGKRNQVRRKLKDSNSVFKVAPSGEESQILFDLFRRIKRGEFPKETHTFIEDTRIEKTVLMHAQERNAHGKIFGGHLMREAYELAWVAAYLHGEGAYPDFHRIDDVIFHAPVDIGSVCRFIGSPFCLSPDFFSNSNLRPIANASCAC
eukprot:TRINITY_DN5934_c0_g1_i1.p1 TRINITY_DN5934_c0_g1~~TRINITY_DN5934_c0_g1_i1.p1  ORF type:complete len:388 (+),score=79.32 TRINITY_DN5934_c0_g1_i1:128-1291(+)